LDLITVEDYLKYNGDSYEPLYPEELEAILERAADIVDSVTGGRLNCAGERLPPAVREKAVLAIFAEAAFIERNGGLSSLDSSSPVQMSLGKFSYMHASGTVERKAFPVSPLAVSYLEAVGLLGRSLCS